jgi:hypothetical protein
MLHAWIKKRDDGKAVTATAASLSGEQLEIRQLSAALAQATMERDILKKATAYLRACRGELFYFLVLPRQNKFEFQVLPRQNKVDILHLKALSPPAGIAAVMSSHALA